MAHEQDPEIGELTLQSKHMQACMRARIEYARDPDGKLVMYASTLYIARKDKAVRPYLMGWFELLVWPLIKKIKVVSREKNADALDVISTSLAWWGYCIRGYDSIAAQGAAYEAVGLGLELTEHEPSASHTRTLLMITLARIMFWTHNANIGMAHLREAAKRASHIADANQRSRVLRNCGILMGLHWHPIKGTRLLFKAKRVRGIAPDVKAKNRLIG